MSINSLKPAFCLAARSENLGLIAIGIETEMRFLKCMKLKKHIFVCTNEREPGHKRGCCKDKGSESLVKLFKEELKGAGLSKEVRAQRSGCLDVCEFGPAIVVYPEGVWYGSVRPEDVKEIVDSHIAQGKVVERLKIPGK